MIKGVMNMQGLVTRNDKWYTYDDYLKLDEDQNYEVVGGELVLVPRPRPYHQKIVNNLTVFLKNFLWQNYIGEIYSDVDVVLGDQVVSPDIIFIAKNRLSIVGEINVQGVPDLVIEVLSPSTEKYDRKKKSRLYHKSGVKEYWIVNPGLQLVEIFVAVDNDWSLAGVYDEEDVLVSPALPGLQIILKKLFENPGQ